MIYTREVGQVFGSAEWMIQNDTAELRHVLRQASDHSLLLLSPSSSRIKTGVWFTFESNWTKGQQCEDMVKDTWGRPVEGSRMFRVKQKLKWCKLSFLKWRKKQKCNVKKEIEIIQ